MEIKHQIILVAFVCGVFCTLVGKCQSPLSQVIVITSHGPHLPHPQEEKIAREDWNKNGQLTQNGWRMMYLFGASLRARYLNRGVLAEKFNTKFSIQTGDSFLLYQAGLALLEGLFPMGLGPSLNNIQPRQPLRYATEPKYHNLAMGNDVDRLYRRKVAVPMNVGNSTKDRLLGSLETHVCGKVADILNDLVRTARTDIYPAFRDQIKDLAAKTNRTFDDLDLGNLTKLVSLLDEIIAHKFENNSSSKYHSIYSGNDWNNLSLISDIGSMYLWGSSKALQTLGLRSLVEEINNNIQKKTDTFIIYNADDRILHLILTGFKVSTHHCLLKRLRNEMKEAECPSPGDYGSNLIIEIFKDNTVQMYYNDYPLKIKKADGSGDLDLKEFQERILRNFTMTDEQFYELCRYSGIEGQIKKDITPTIFLMGFGALFALILAGSVFLFKFLRVYDLSDRHYKID